MADPQSPVSNPTCQVVRTNTSYTGLQGFTYGEGISAQSVGAQMLCMHLLRLPPGARAQPHLHANHETAIYVLEGNAAMWYGEQLEHHVAVQAGDFLYIPAGVPHLPYNPSSADVVAVIARTDPNDQESVVLRPDLAAIHPE